MGDREAKNACLPGISALGHVGEKDDILKGFRIIYPNGFQWVSTAWACLSSNSDLDILSRYTQSCFEQKKKKKSRNGTEDPLSPFPCIKILWDLPQILGLFVAAEFENHIHLRRSSSGDLCRDPGLFISFNPVATPTAYQRLYLHP